MVFDGKTVFTLWGYIPKTEIAIKWHKLSNGNFKGCDRTADEDVYEGTVTFRGPESELIDLETVLDDNRKQFNATFNSGEEIFGADVDYSGTLSVMVVDYGKISQSDFKIFEMNLTIRLLNPTFKSTAPDFTKLRTASHANTRETEFELNKLFTYEGEANVIDRISNDGDESGIFRAIFDQTIKEMSAIRRYLTVTARATKIPFPTFGGITKPFGNRGPTLPVNCRVIDWRDLGRKDHGDWSLSITFARELSYWNS